MALAVLAGSLLGAGRGTAAAQIGSLVSPGPLSRAHASLEGVKNCEQCHERGRKVAADRCLACHAPIAAQIARNAGVHRAVKDDCVQCHVEHTGVNGELRPFDMTKFNHATDTSFPLDGRHAAIADKCASCHKTRSFLAAKTACDSCHADVHKGELGPVCTQCHSTSVAFKDTSASFDHRRTSFPLTGAHQTVACADCHKAGTFKIARSSSCGTCHATPHPASVSTTCTTCHTTARWMTSKFDHATTKFPLSGAHAVVACTGCHRQSPLKAKVTFGTCATCHTDPHRGEFTEDCSACHTEKSFAGGAFDHAARTSFALADGHAGVACERCHTTVAIARQPAAKVSADFRGLGPGCATCHADPHRGELGTACSTCHSARTFQMTAFIHPRAQDLFGGRHAALACEACHKPVPLPAAAATGAPRVALAGGSLTKTPTACASCHRDVHLGQVGADCQTCHSLAAPQFTPDRFDHGTSVFHLAGAHATVACDRCHKSETADFPSGHGTAVRLSGVGTSCRTCHNDVHLGQVSQTCETCHSVDTFKIAQYVHKTPPRDFFVGPHLKAACTACHKQATDRFPSGSGTAVRFAVGTTCTSCHEDIHHGALGSDCRACHRIAP